MGLSDLYQADSNQLNRRDASDWTILVAGNT